MNYPTSHIKEIDQLKETLNQLLPFSQENQNRLQKKIRLEFNYNSNHIEGNTLTYGQTQLLLLFDKSTGDVLVSDIEEMKAHDLALSQIIELSKEDERPLSEIFIKELNKIILVKPFWKDAISPNGVPTRKKIEIGQYKSSPNSVLLRNGEIYEYASPEETPALMRDLLDWYEENKGKLHPVHLAALFHYKFVCIHPFDDGNGRVARLLMNFILLRYNFPMIIIKSDDKEKYLTSLQKADTGDTLSLLEYIEKQAIHSLLLSIKAGKGESIEEKDDVNKQIEILKREKLSKTKIFKTPKISYELISHIKDDIWDKVNHALIKFDDFFAETSIDIYIDNIKYRKIRTVSRNPLNVFTDKEEEIYRYKVYGTDLEEMDVEHILWVRKMHALKSVSKKQDYTIGCSLDLYESSYQLTISIDDIYRQDKQIIFEISNDYSSYLMNEITDIIIQDTSKYLISVIQTQS